MTRNDITLTPQRIAELSNPPGIIAFFAELGYNTDLQHAPAVDKELLLRIHKNEELQRKIKHFRRIARDSDETAVMLNVFLYVLTSITAKTTQELVRDIQKLHNGYYLLVLATESESGEFNQLELIYLDPTGPERSASFLQPALPGTVSELSSSYVDVTQPRMRSPLVIDRRHPSRVALRALRQLAYTRHTVWEQCKVISEAFTTAETSEEYFNNHALFSDHYLKQRLPTDVPEWLWTERANEEQDQMQTAYEELRRLYAGAASTLSGKAMPEISASLFEPVLRILGFNQQPISKNGVQNKKRAEQDGKRQPDYAFMLKNQDSTETHVICQAYPWGRTLDDVLENAGDETYAGDPTAGENPAVVIVSLLQQEQAQWAILTNGRLWRLYSAKARSRATNYYEIDLQEALAIHRQDVDEALKAFRYFWLFFRSPAFVARARQDYDRPPYICWLEFLMRESEKYARQLGDSLKERIFDDIFPHFAQGFVSYAQQTGRLDDLRQLSPEARAAALKPYFDGTLTFLYRLLFLFYAESRDLLPLHDERYFEQSLQSIKDEVARSAKDNKAQVPRNIRAGYADDPGAIDLYKRLYTLFEAIDKGNPDLNVPTYNGGLFMTVFKDEKLVEAWSAEERVARFLNEYKIPNRYLALGLDLMARDVDEKKSKLSKDADILAPVDYKSLGVRQLGSIYEGLLEFKLRYAVVDMAVVQGKYITLDEAIQAGQYRPGKTRVVEADKIYIENDRHERKATGSYTPPTILPIVGGVV